MVLRVWVIDQVEAVGEQRSEFREQADGTWMEIKSNGTVYQFNVISIVLNCKD